MPYMIGIADGEYDLWGKLKNFITGVGFIGQPIITPVGGGARPKLHSWQVHPEFINKVATFTCDFVDAPNYSSTWEVNVGGVDDIDAQSSVAYKSISNVGTNGRPAVVAYIDIDSSNQWLVGDQIALKCVELSTAGAGKVNTIAPSASTVTETITLTCTQKGSAAVSADTEVLLLPLNTQVDIPRARNLSAVSVKRTSDDTAVPAGHYTMDLVNGKITLTNDTIIGAGQQATITFNATSSAAVFSVSGSVTDYSLQGLSTYTEGTAFDSLQVDFTINRVSATVRAEQFQTGDTVTIYTTQNPLKALGQEWVEVTAGNGLYPQVSTAYHGSITENQDQKVIYKGRGLAGTDEFYIGMYRSVEQNVNSIWRLKAFRSFNSLVSFESQTGWKDKSPRLTMWHNEVPFWIVADGRTINVVAKSSTYYTMMTAGLYLPDEEPQYNPYPVLVGGDHGAADATTTTRWSDVAGTHSCFFHPRKSNGSYSTEEARPTLMFLDKYNNWQHVDCRDSAAAAESKGFEGSSQPYASDNYAVYPYYCDGMAMTRENLDGSYTPIPLEIIAGRHNPASPYVRQPFVGRIDKWYAVSGYGNQTPENLLITTDAKKLVVFHNVYRNQVDEYVALELS